MIYTYYKNYRIKLFLIQICTYIKFNHENYNYGVLYYRYIGFILRILDFTEICTTITNIMY